MAKNETEAAWDSTEYNAERVRKYENVLRDALFARRMDAIVRFIV